MRLSEFIRQELDPIVAEWSEFAKTCIPPARDLSLEDLSDHAKALLQHVADDMEQPQSGQEQHDKSRGNRPENAPRVTEMARKDAEQRFRQGFSLNEMFSEHRALRATVIRRSSEQLKSSSLEALQEVTRFNEAMDQASSEAIALYVDRVEESRNVMLGVLGHDLRNPLGAVGNSAEYLLRTDGLTGAQTKAAARIKSSTRRMAQMVNDLLDFTRTRFGGGLPINRVPADLCQVCREVMDELEAFHPERELRIDCTGNLRGEWDVPRLSQLVSNLVANAIQHGAPETPVTIKLSEEGDAVRLEVHNQGAPIATDALRTLFDPEMRPVLQKREPGEGSSGLGLGLYIVREIARAHGGHIAVESSAREGTTMNVRLERGAERHRDGGAT